MIMLVGYYFELELTKLMWHELCDKKSYLCWIFSVGPDWAKNKNTIVPRNVGDEKNLHLCGCKFIFLTNLIEFWNKVYT